MQFPLVEPFSLAAPPDALFARVAHLPQAIFLDSADAPSTLGRFSFIAADPFLRITAKHGKTRVNGKLQPGNPFDVLQQFWQKFPMPSRADLPPFQGGIAGYWGYELGQAIEKLPVPPLDDLSLADMAVGFYDCVLAIEHTATDSRAWFIASGYPETDPTRRTERARARIAYFRALLSRIEPKTPPWQPRPAMVQSSFYPAAYFSAIQQVKSHIAAGNIYQANIAQQFRTDFDGNPLAMYRALRRKNPAPFAAFLQIDDTAIASVSPERFLQCRAGMVETRPIKGTRPRGKTPAADSALAAALQTSEKDRAENVMIVDLLRNDLSRVSKFFSVRVPSLLAVEKHPNVWHLVSTITAELRADQTPIDLLKATFPGGSITGAPKIRAMEIITDTEKRTRGVYCGSIGYLGFDGTLDTSIAIRTMVIKNGTAFFHGGGGIVADSDPQMEYEESLVKVKMFFDILKGTLATE